METTITTNLPWLSFNTKSHYTIILPKNTHFYSRLKIDELKNNPTPDYLTQFTCIVNIFGEIKYLGNDEHYIEKQDDQILFYLICMNAGEVRRNHHTLKIWYNFQDMPIIIPNFHKNKNSEENW